MPSLAGRAHRVEQIRHVISLAEVTARSRSPERRSAWKRGGQSVAVSKAEESYRLADLAD